MRCLWRETTQKKTGNVLWENESLRPSLQRGHGQQKDKRRTNKMGNREYEMGGIKKMYGNIINDKIESLIPILEEEARKCKQMANWHEKRNEEEPRYRWFSVARTFNFCACELEKAMRSDYSEEINYAAARKELRDLLERYKLDEFE